jgi:hypothetical protein
MYFPVGNIASHQCFIMVEIGKESYSRTMKTFIHPKLLASVDKIRSVLPVAGQFIG